MALGFLQAIVAEWNRDFATPDYDFCVTEDCGRIVLRRRPVLPLVVATREEVEDCLPVNKAAQGAVAYVTGAVPEFLTPTQIWERTRRSQ